MSYADGEAERRKKLSTCSKHLAKSSRIFVWISKLPPTNIQLLFLPCKQGGNLFVFPYIMFFCRYKEVLLAITRLSFLFPFEKRRRTCRARGGFIKVKHYQHLSLNMVVFYKVFRDYCNSISSTSSPLPKLKKFPLTSTKVPVCSFSIFSYQACVISYSTSSLLSN